MNNHFIGNQEILKRPSFTIYSSQKIPLAILHSAKMLFNELLQISIAISGGWQSPLERRLLKDYTDQSRAHLIIFLAKKYSAYQLPKSLQAPFKNNKVLIVEPTVKNKRITKESVRIRDEIIERLINNFIFLYIHKNGYLEKRFFNLLRQNKNVFILKHPLNQQYFLDGVHLIDETNARELIHD